MNLIIPSSEVGRYIVEFRVKFKPELHILMSSVTFFCLLDHSLGDLLSLTHQWYHVLKIGKSAFSSDFLSREMVTSFVDTA